MSIVNKIISSVQASTGYSCLYNSEAELDRLLDNAPLPCAWFTLISDGSVINETAQMRESVDVAIFFCDKSEFDFDSIENETILERLRGDAFAWLNSLNTGGDLSYTGDIQTSRIYERYDVNVTAYGVRITITENVGLSKC